MPFFVLKVGNAKCIKRFLYTFNQNAYGYVEQEGRDAKPRERVILPR